MDYTTRTKSCRVCDGAVKLFNKAPDHGVKFSVYTGEDDSTTEAHIREKMTYEVEKKKKVTLYI